MPDVQPASGKARATRLYIAGGATVLIAALAVGYFHFSRSSSVATAREARGNVVNRGPRVEVVTPVQGPKERTVTLLADVRSNQSATLYAKVSGYVKTLEVDRGDRVQANQIVAVIESPEIDQQYAAAVTDLEHKRRNLARSQDLFAKGNTTQVAMLQYETDARVAEANVKGLETMKGYQVIRAPFAGRVTQRFVDQGALVTNAQTNMVSALPLMTVSDDSRLRVYCYVQQADVPYVNVGDVAEVVDASNPERKMQAKISRMTGELETRTRTMQIEVNIDNTEGFLVAGSFANVTLHIPIQSYPQIPVSGLLVRGSETLVAMVENDTLRYKPVRVASTDGNTVTVAEGLRQDDRIAINLPDEVTDGSRVQPVLRKQ
ncbi:efflux RND transporter periplasmic adaptor subunit [Rhodoplanes sp. Z2-YC6860]|uniref:efflux RND transporter periplasmic adaptor subunit n=1 Tax=Rhodoplanes sp. Z2-YC6860 TaxID=674703 RepID=UPI00078D622F|nr:efflux RND transporter periplasmic adaptor subunit [Rhodoplanes sp. Z2-YC6860]AMN41816.1 efflux transporter, RND family, MFP subunit [Rhodoplanes sp. Z2-YC6860]